MTRTKVNIDEELFGEAQRALGTAGVSATVNAALAAVVRQHALPASTSAWLTSLITTSLTRGGIAGQPRQRLGRIGGSVADPAEREDFRRCDADEQLARCSVARPILLGVLGAHVPAADAGRPSLQLTKIAA